MSSLRTRLTDSVSNWLQEQHAQDRKVKSALQDFFNPCHRGSSQLFEATLKATGLLGTAHTGRTISPAEVDRVYQELACEYGPTVAHKVMKNVLGSEDVWSRMTIAAKLHAVSSFGVQRQVFDPLPLPSFPPPSPWGCGDDSYDTSDAASADGTTAAPADDGSDIEDDGDDDDSVTTNDTVGVNNN